MFRKALLLPVLALALGACNDAPTWSGGLAHLKIQLTDAPSDYIAAAIVDIGEIQVLSAGGPPLTVVEDAGSYDLLQLQNGVTADLGRMAVAPGVYTELRMIVQSAEITLKDGYQFATGETTRTIKVPSGAQTGIKISLSTAGAENGAGVEIRTGETVLVVDFDVAQNFVMQGDAESPAGIKGFIFTPRLRAVARDVAGSIAGTVSAPDGVSTEGLTVSATRTDVTDAPVATTITSATGKYKINFLPPGAYVVVVSTPPAGFTSSKADPTVDEAQDVTGVDLSLSATP